MTDLGPRDQCRLRFLATLDTLTEAAGWRLLEIEETDELCELYTVAVKDYGRKTAAARIVGDVLYARLDGRPSVHVRGWKHMKPETQAALSAMIVLAAEAVQRGDFDEPEESP